jgi:hypothetical protein
LVSFTMVGNPEPGQKKWAARTLAGFVPTSRLGERK